MTLFTKTAHQLKGKGGKPGVVEVKEERPRRKFLKNGESVIVRIPNAESFVEYYSHGGYFLSSKFGVFSSVCTRHTGQKDAYDLAVEVMYNDLKEIEKEKGKDSKEYKELHMIANDLRAKRKLLFGFINLEDGQPVIYELSGGQGDGLVEQILKNEKKLNKFAFELAKSGEGVNTRVTLTLLDLEDDLNANHQANWEATKNAEFDMTLFEKCLYVQPEEKKIEDLVKIGFDVTRIGFEAPTAHAEENKQTEQVEEIKGSDLPF